VALNAAQRRVLEEWMRSKAIVACPACGQSRWRFAGAAYVRALLEAGLEDLMEEAGVVKVPCDTAGTWRSSTPRRSASGGCGRKGGSCSTRWAADTAAAVLQIAAPKIRVTSGRTSENALSRQLGDK
jgi:hypothetical protein